MCKKWAITSLNNEYIYVSSFVHLINIPTESTNVKISQTIDMTTIGGYKYSYFESGKS